MDAEREREIRELAERLSASKRHRKIGLVLGELLAEIDALRPEEESGLTFEESVALIQKYVEAGRLARNYRPASSDTWREAVKAKLPMYPDPPQSSKESSTF